jgi:nucleoside-diphosphate-sugar epimerase
MPKTVVTGGAGFIGSTLVRKLLERGDSVAVIDNLLTGKESNLDAVRDRIEFHRVDICDVAALSPVMFGADVVYHLAAIPSVPRSIDDPVPSHEVNIDGTFNVFHAASGAGVRRVIYAASSAAYGDSETLPKIETMLPRPKSPYAVQKLLGEYYASVFHSCFGLETVALRFFNVYGPRQDPTSPYSGVLSLFMKHLLARTEPTIFGDGEQSRDFTFVEDVAELCIKASLAPAAAGKMYNAGNGGRFTLNYIWDALQKMEGVEIAAKYGPPRAGDVRHSMADTTAAAAGLDHAPRFTIEEGLKRTLEWYRQAQAAAGA